MIIWNEAFATGLPAVDRQHRLLINQINQLEAVLAQPHPTGPEIICARRLVIFLESYAKMYFHFETTGPDSDHCPAPARHQRPPVKLVGLMATCKKKFRAGGFSVGAFTEWYPMTRAWFARHILRVAVQLLTCVQARVGQT